MKPCGQLCPWNTLYGCHKPENEPCILSNMPCEKFEPKPQTNADHIRSMTDEELAKWLVLRTVYSESAWSAPSYLNFKTCTDDDFDGALKGTSEWLKQPYKEDL